MKVTSLVSYGTAAVAVSLLAPLAAALAGCSSEAATETSSTTAAGGGSRGVGSGGSSMSGDTGGSGGESTTTGGVTCSGTQVACGGGCVDPASFQADVKNCGACGRDCQGGACTKGVCQPSQVFSPGAFVDGKPKIVQRLALDSKFLYFSDLTDLFRCPKEGCGAGDADLVMVSKSDPAKMPFWYGPLVVEGTRAFSLQYDDKGSRTLVTQCDLSGSLPNASYFYKVPTDDEIVEIVGDRQGYIYFTDRKRILRRCPVSGCGSNGENVQVIASDKRGAITFDTASVYLGNGANSLLKCPQSGCGNGNVNAAVLATGLNVPVSAATDEQNVYFVFATSSELIATCPKAGCGDKNKNLVKLYTNPSPGVLASYELLVDATNIYWILTPIDATKTTDSQLVKCPKSGCGDKNSLAVTIATGKFISALMQDEKSLYWIQSVDGTLNHNGLMRLAK